MKPDDREGITEYWFDKEENNTAENLLKILPEKGELRHRQSHARYWLDKKFETDLEKRCEALIPLMKAGVFDKYAALSQTKELLGNPGGKALCNFCAEVYDNEEWRRGVVEYFVSQGQITKDNLEDLQKPFGKIERREDAADFVDMVKRRLGLSNFEVLTITKGKTDQLKDFYENVFGRQNEKPLAEVLNEAGMRKVTADFGAENLAPIRLADLISYYDFVAEEGAAAVAAGRGSGIFLDNCLKLEIREQIKAEYKPHYERAYIPNVESALLRMITGYELPQVGTICDALSGKMPSVPTGVTTCKINFDGVDEFSEDEKQRITKSFEAILQTPQPTKEDVADFFKRILGLEGDLSGEKQQDFLNLYQQNKNTLAHFFAQENGMRDFKICATSRADGCYANLANQLGSVLNSKLFEQSGDEYLPILYSCFSTQLAVPILRSNWAVHDSSNPLTNSKVKEEFFYPAGLLADLEKEFCDREGRMAARNPYEIIQKKFGECGLGDESMAGASAGFSPKEAAKLAACITLEKTLPGLFLHSSLLEVGTWFDEKIGKEMSLASGLRDDGGVSESKGDEPARSPAAGSVRRVVGSELSQKT